MKQNFIAGGWVDGADAAPNVNPSDLDDVIADYAQASVAQVDDAVASATAAFPAWSRTSPERRADILETVAAELLARSGELGRLLAREEGKTLAEGIGEVVRAGRVFRFFAGEALRQGGEWLPSVRPGVTVEIRREAEGVIGIVTPWNFPIAIPAWKIAPALAFGNCVVFKPAELVPGSAWALAEILSRAGLPDGVFNLVMGTGSVVGATLVAHPDVRAISFTGSTMTGAHIGQQCFARGAKVQLEMGGKNPLVVLDDADLAQAVDVALNGAFFATGQRCTASSRLIVTDAIHDRFVAMLAARIDALVVGHALDADTQIGPVVSQAQLDIDLEYIRAAAADGARLVTGGTLLDRRTRGHYLGPALFADTDNAMRINREEVFGPVATVLRVRDYDEALAVANDTRFGLSAGICTQSLRHADDFRANARAGMVMVNLPTAGVDYHAPFGGRRASSYGSREQGSYAREFYTTVKTCYVQA